MSATSERPVRIALIIGITGGIGGAVARALGGKGWKIRALTRRRAGERAQDPSLAHVDWVTGDAMREADVAEAARGVELIFHGANPPQYKNWRGLAMPMLAHAISAARMSKARLVFPGNVYNFGPDAFPLLREDSPQHPCSRKGAVRVEMEGMLRDAAGNGVRSLVIRAGDFFGPRQRDSWLQSVMLRPGKPITKVAYPGDPEIGHAWAYLPDLAEAIARLAEIERTLPTFDVFHFGGHWLERGRELPEAILRVAGRPANAITSVPWVLYRLATPFVPLLREVMEMRYLWQVPVRLDNRKLAGCIGAEPHTPLDEAVTATLRDLGCLRKPAN